MILEGSYLLQVKNELPQLLGTDFDEKATGLFHRDFLTKQRVFS
jgi:hypothetical protein